MSRFKAMIAIGTTILAASAASAHDVRTLDSLTVKAGTVTEISYPVDPGGSPVTVYTSDGFFWDVAAPAAGSKTGVLLVKATKPDTCSDIFIFSGEKRLSQRLCAVE
jgi:hypothetical protein